MSVDRRVVIGTWVFRAGFAMPVIALLVYLALCPEPTRPCGGGGPGTCLGGIHWNCFNPGYVWLYSSIGALVVIFVGEMIRRTARIDPISTSLSPPESAEPPRPVPPPDAPARSGWRAQLGRVVWGGVLGFAVFEFVNRVWLGLDGAPGDGSWTDWHRDRAAVAIFVLAAIGGLRAYRRKLPTARPALGWLKATFLVFIPTWVGAGAVTVGVITVTEPCSGAGANVGCALAVMAIVLGTGLVVAAIVTAIAVSGFRSAGRGLGRAHGWALVATITIWLTILGSIAVPDIIERNEQRREGAVRAEARRSADAEYEAALHAWWAERVAEILGTELRPTSQSDPHSRTDAFAEMGVNVGDELIATTMDGSRSITAVWLFQGAGLSTGLVHLSEFSVPPSELPAEMLLDFVETRGNPSLLTTRRHEWDEGKLLLVFSTEPATGMPLATEAEIGVVADFRLAAEGVFDYGVLCDRPAVPVVLYQDNGQPPYRECPPVVGRGEPPPIVALPDTQAPQIATSPPGQRTDPGFALSGFQVEMVGLGLEVPVLVEFATETHDDWDRREAALGRSERQALYDLTEGKLTRLVSWTQELGARVAASESVAGRDSSYTGVQGAAVRVEEAARATLEGLRLPSSAETVPGAARRLGMLEFQRAAADLDDAVLAALGGDLRLSSYEMDMIALRLEVAGLSYSATAVNQRWDDGEAGYDRTEWELLNLEGRVLGLAGRMHAIEPPKDRRVAFGVVEDACGRLEAASGGMLAGLRLVKSAEIVPGTMRAESLEDFRDAAETVDRVAAIALGVPEARWRPLPAAPAPKTVMPDTEPPTLTATTPVPGSVVSESTVLITGTTESGVFVAANGQAAAVDEDGAWSAQLALEPGNNVVKVTATDTGGNVTTITYEIHRGYVLRGNGIGPADGGDPPEAVIAQFTTIFGAPTEDRMHPNPGGNMSGYWAYSYARFVYWSDDGIRLVFTDGGHFRSDNKPGLISWSTTNPTFVTERGITAGSTRADLEAAYGSQLAVEAEDECSPAGTFYVTLGPHPTLIIGQLTGPPYGPTSIVVSLGGGSAGSC